MDTLQQIMIDNQRAHPGVYDGVLINSSGVSYDETMHGLNPLGRGFNDLRPRQGPHCPNGPDAD